MSLSDLNVVYRAFADLDGCGQTTRGFGPYFSSIYDAKKYGQDKYGLSVDTEKFYSIKLNGNNYLLKDPTPIEVLYSYTERDKTEELKKQALSKLSSEERKALGL